MKRPAPNIKPYSKAKPTAIPPYTTETVVEYLADSCARCSWIIPLRGSPPWEMCTPALILASSFAQDAGKPEVFPSGPVQNIIGSEVLQATAEISWTHNAILDFWNFLLELRDAGALGPIALSFHASPGENHSLDSRKAPECPSPVVGSDPLIETTLSSLDHFRICHVARYAMQIRNVLDAWSFIPSPKVVTGPLSVHDTMTHQYTATDSPNTAAKIRMLKGARLVLLDEQSRGVLMC